MKFLYFLFLSCIVFKITSHKSMEEIKADLFYTEINNTLREYSQMYSKRINCIINTLKHKKVIQNVNESFYNFTSANKMYELIIINRENLMKQLEPIIDSAKFGCTIVGFCAIFLICAVLFIVISCVACLYK